MRARPGSACPCTFHLHQRKMGCLKTSSSRTEGCRIAIDLLLLLTLMARFGRDDMNFLGSHHLICPMFRVAEIALHDFSLY